MSNEEAIAEHSAEDAFAAKQMPSAIPKGYKGPSFLVPNLPTDLPFTFAEVPEAGDVGGSEVSSVTLLGPYSPEEFVTDPTNNVTSTHNPDGTPFVLRCVRQHQRTQGLWLDCIDDDCSQITYHVQTVQDNALEIEDF